MHVRKRMNEVFVHRAKRGGVALRTVARRDGRNPNGSSEPFDCTLWWRKRCWLENFNARGSEQHGAGNHYRDKYQDNETEQLKKSLQHGSGMEAD